MLSKEKIVSKPDSDYDEYEAYEFDHVLIIQ